MVDRFGNFEPRRCAPRNMGDFGQGYVGTSGDAAVGQSLEKKRAKLFAASDQEKRRLAQETAAYRLKNEGDKFSSSSNAPEVSLSQATVGLVSKEEWARRRAALEAPPAEAEAPPADPPKEKKKKKQGGGGALSFAFDEEDGGEGSSDVAPPKKKLKPQAEHVIAPAEAEAPAAAAPAAATAPPAAASATTPLPSGHVCLRMMGGGVLEVQCEVRASQTLARSRVVGISAHHVSLDIKAADTGKGDEVNAAVCGFMRSVLGGAAVTVEVIRGYRAPIKTLKVLGVDSADMAYHRLLLAKGFPA